MGPVQVHTPITALPATLLAAEAPGETLRDDGALQDFDVYQGIDVRVPPVNSLFIPTGTFRSHHRHRRVPRLTGQGSAGVLQAGSHTVDGQQEQPLQVLLVLLGQGVGLLPPQRFQSAQLQV